MTALSARLCVAVFLSSANFFLAVPLIPLYIVTLDPHSTLAGPTIAVSFALSGLLSPLWGSLAERYGPQPMMIRAASLVCVAYALSAWSTSIGSLFASRCLAGVASGFVPVATTAMVRLSSPERRSTDLGWLSSAKSAGALVGPTLGGLLVWWTGSFRLAFLAAAVTSVLTVLVSISLPSMTPRPDRTPETAEDRTERPVGTLQVALPALALTFLLTGAGLLIQVWLPFAVSAVQGAPRAAGIVGLTLACASGATMLLAPIWGRAADRARPGKVLAATVLLPIPALAGLGLTNDTALVVVLFVAASLLGSEALALLGAEVTHHLPQQRIGPYFGWSNSVAQAASAAGAVVTPLLVSTSTDLPVWACVTLYLGAGALVVWVVRVVRRPNGVAIVRTG